MVEYSALDFLRETFGALPLYLCWLVAGLFALTKLKSAPLPAKIVIGVSLFSIGELFVTQMFYSFVFPELWNRFGDTTRHVSLGVNFFRAIFVALLIGALVYAVFADRDRRLPDGTNA